MCQSRGGSGIRRRPNPAPQLLIVGFGRPTKFFLCTSHHPSCPLRHPLQRLTCASPILTMGNLFSHSDPNDASSQSSSSLKRQGSTTASAVGLKQTISQNMRLSKSKVTSFLKGNHMNYSIVHKNHFYNSLPHVFFPSLSRSVDGIAYWCRIFVWGCATTVTGDL
jgi:hypothetical protein